VDLRVPATDGFPLAATLVGEPRRGVVLVSSATAVPRAYYAPFAAFLAERGWLVATYDYRGIGESVPAPRDATMTQWGSSDMAGMLAFLEKEHPERPLVLVGHSAGGQLVCMTDLAARASALVGVAAQSGYWRHWRGASRWRRFVEWNVGIPVVTTLFGKVPAWAGVGAELPKGVAREWARWCRHPDYLLRDDADARRARYRAVRAHVLAWGFDDDDYGPRGAVDWWAAQFPNAASVTRAQEPRGGHFGFFKPRHEAWWARTAGWLETRLPQQD
jgi:predicted alpha/beta hydrolase